MALYKESVAHIVNSKPDERANKEAPGESIGNRYETFDKVSHLHLFHELHHYGIRGDLLTWIKDFVSNRSQQVIAS